MMGPHEDPKMDKAMPKPAKVDEQQHSEGEEEDDGDNDGWHIGFEVEMRGVGVDRLNVEDVDEDGTTENGSDSGGSSTAMPGTRPDGYQQLQQHPTSSTGTAANEEWLPSMPGLAFPPALPPISDLEEFKIKHQPIGISLDREKEDQIRSIMGKMGEPRLSAGPLAPPSWLQNIDDRQLTDLVRKLAKKAED